MKNSCKSPVCVIIAGPNGSGKTTFAREFLAHEAGIFQFVNADLIAAGLSPLNPDLSKLTAGRLFLAEMDRFAKEKKNFAFETTLSGLVYLPRIKSWKETGYEIRMVYLRLATVAMACQRIRERVRQGGHHVPAADVKRRFKRGWENFQNLYRPLADFWAVYDNSGKYPKLMEEKNENND